MYRRDLQLRNGGAEAQADLWPLLHSGITFWLCPRAGSSCLQHPRRTPASCTPLGQVRLSDALYSQQHFCIDKKLLLSGRIFAAAGQKQGAARSKVGAARAPVCLQSMNPAGCFSRKSILTLCQRLHASALKLPKAEQSPALPSNAGFVH